MHATCLDPSDAKLFSRYKPLVDSIARKFSGKSREDLEDAKQDAYLFYTNAIKTWDRCRSDLQKHITCTVSRQLIDRYRKNKQKIKLVNTDERVDPVDPKSNPRWILEDFEEQLSRDAKNVVMMCVCFGTFESRGSVKECLRSFGWTRRRIVESFGEIRKALR